jgi:hypothetical protein
MMKLVRAGEMNETIGSDHKKSLCIQKIVAIGAMHPSADPDAHAGRSRHMNQWKIGSLNSRFHFVIRELSLADSGDCGNVQMEGQKNPSREFWICIYSSRQRIITQIGADENPEFQE